MRTATRRRSRPVTTPHRLPDAAEILAATIDLQFAPVKARLKRPRKRRKQSDSSPTRSSPAQETISAPSESASHPEPETVRSAVRESIENFASEDTTTDPSELVGDIRDPGEDLPSRLDEAAEKVAFLGQLVEQDLQVLAEETESPTEPPPAPEFEQLGSRLDTVLDAVTELQTQVSGFDECRQWIEEIRGNTEIGQAKRDILTGMLSGLNDEVKELRSQVALTQKAAMKSADKTEDMTRALTTSPPPSARLASAPSATSSRIAPTTVLGAGVLLLSWAVMLYLRTESPVYVVLALVVINLTGCATILLGRRTA